MNTYGDITPRGVAGLRGCAEFVCREDYADPSAAAEDEIGRIGKVRITEAMEAAWKKLVTPSDSDRPVLGRIDRVRFIRSEIMQKEFPAQKTRFEKRHGE